MVAFVIRFGVFGPTLDIHIHGTYIVIAPRVITFWLLLVVAAVWLAMTAFKFRFPRRLCHSKRLGRVQSRPRQAEREG